MQVKAKQSQDKKSFEVPKRNLILVSTISLVQLESELVSTPKFAPKF